VLNAQTSLNGLTEVAGITVTGTPQTLLIAVAGCGATTPGTGGIVNGTFDNPASITNPPWDTTGTTGAAGSVIVITGGGPAGSNAARLGCAACTAGGTSVLAQTFTAGGSSLTFDYEQSCISGAGSLNVTLKNNTTNSLTSLIINRCTTDRGLLTLTPPAVLIPGDNYTLAFKNTQAPGNIATTLLANVVVS
jgi:hypothetical protein